jgi:hypothetical protein
MATPWKKCEGGAGDWGLMRALNKQVAGSRSAGEGAHYEERVRDYAAAKLKGGVVTVTARQRRKKGGTWLCMT